MESNLALENPVKPIQKIQEALTPESEIVPPAPVKAVQIRESMAPELMTDGKTLVEKLSFTHLAEPIRIEEPLRSAFYEIEGIRGNWSVRELRRQIASPSPKTSTPQFDGTWRR